MHAILLHAYHLLVQPLHLLLSPVWRPVIAAAAIAGIVRLVGGSMAVAAGLAAVGGWAVQDFATLGVFPPPPFARLPGLAAIILIDALLRARGPARSAWWILPAVSAAAAWWMRGAPLTGPGIVNTMPIFLGLLAAFPLARRMARGESGWGGVGAALALAGGLLVVAAPLHWVRAALVPAASAAALLGMADAAPVVAGLIVVLAGATMVASDRGRLVPLDAACLLPLLAWALASRLTPRIARFGPALAGLLAACVCIGLAWAVRQALAGR